jgi:hypothetical protein
VAEKPAAVVTGGDGRGRIHSMSMLFGPASSDPSVNGLPRGEVLGTYPTYQAARKVVDQLAEGDFDVRTVSIVGTDLRTVERIRNRLTYPSVALRSAVQGAFFGLMIGILMTLIDPSGSGFQILYTVGLGVGIWVLFGVLGHSMRKGRGVDSVQQLVPTSFDVVCEFESAARARQVLGQAPATGPVAPAPHPAPGPGATPGNQPPAGQSPGHQAPGEQAPGHEVASSGQGVPDAIPGPASAPTPPATQPPPATPVSVAPVQRPYAYPDLPDGRPQFGVRLPEDEAQAVRDRILQDNAARQGRTGQGPGTFKAPDYGQRGGAAGTGGPGPMGGTATGPAGETTSGAGRRTDPDRPVDGGAAPSEPGDRPASGAPEDGTDPFARPRYGRRSAVPVQDHPQVGPESEATTEPGAEPGTAPDTTQDQEGRDTRD